MTMPEWAKDTIIIHSTIYFSRWDAFKAWLGRPFFHDFKIHVELPVKYELEEKVHMGDLIKRRHQGMAEVVSDSSGPGKEG